MPTYNNLFTYERKSIKDPLVFDQGIKDGQVLYHNCTLLRNIEELKKDQVVPCIVPSISLLVWTSEDDYTEVYV